MAMPNAPSSYARHALQPRPQAHSEVRLESERLRMCTHDRLCLHRCINITTSAHTMYERTDGELAERVSQVFAPQFCSVPFRCTCKVAFVARNLCSQSNDVRSTVTQLAKARYPLRLRAKYPKSARHSPAYNAAHNATGVTSERTSMGKLKSAWEGILRHFASGSSVDARARKGGWGRSDAPKRRGMRVVSPPHRGGTQPQQ